MDYKLIRTNRKTVAIQLQKDGSVIVRAPKRLAVYRIEAFVKEKQNWIEQHQKRLQEQQRQKESFCLSDGQFPLVGRMLPMQMTQEKAPCWQQTVVFLPEGDEQQLKSSAEQLYRQIARQTLQSRVEHFAPKLGVQPASLRINGAKGRWGSCSGKNRLNFSWRLMLAPEHCIDYVVVHELCHILHHDHSVAFWQEVERVVPDWRSCRQQLVQTARAPWFWE